LRFGYEETGEASIPDYILEGISLTEGEGEGWMGELRKLDFLGSGYLLVLVMLPKQVQWIEGATGTAVAK